MKKTITTLTLVALPFVTLTPIYASSVGARTVTGDSLNTTSSVGARTVTGDSLNTTNTMPDFGDYSSDITNLDTTTSNINEFKLHAIDGHFAISNMQNNTFKTRETLDFKSVFHLGKRKNIGRLSITAMLRNQTHRTAFELGKIQTTTLSNTLGVTYSLATESNNFWGVSLSYGQGDTESSIDWHLSPLQKKQYTLATSKTEPRFSENNLSFASIYIELKDENSQINFLTGLRTQLLPSKPNAKQTREVEMKIEDALKGTDLAIKLKGFSGTQSNSDKTRAFKVQSATSLSSTVAFSVFLGTNIIKNAWHFTPQLTLTYNKKSIDAVDVTATNSPSTSFTLNHHKDLYSDITLSAKRTVKKGSIHINGGVRIDIGSNKQYSIAYTKNPEEIPTYINNNPNRIGFNVGIGYTHPVTKHITTDTVLDFYKNGENNAIKAYVTVGYTF